MPSMTEAALVGKRQEIIDDIFNVESEATPFFSLLKTGQTPNQMLLSWVAEVFPDVPSTGVIDGTAATTPLSLARYLIEGCCQHFRREWGVTTLAGLSNAVGVGRNEAGHQMMVAMMLLKRQMEQQFLSADDCAVETGGTPWTTRGVFSWLSASAQSVKPVNAAVRPSSSNAYTSTFSSLTETAFRNMLESAFSETKDVLSLDGFVGTDLKAAMDDWTNVYPVASSTSQPRTTYHVAGTTEYQSKVEWLRFSVGDVRLHINPFLAVTTSTGAATAYGPKSGAFLNMDLWDKVFMLKPANTNLAPDGSGKKGFVDAVAGLRCKNPRGQVYVYTNS